MSGVSIICPGCRAELRPATPPPPPPFRYRCPSCGGIHRIDATHAIAPPPAPDFAPPPPTAPADVAAAPYGRAWVCEPRGDYAGRLAAALREIGFAPQIITGGDLPGGAEPPRLALVSAYHLALMDALWSRLTADGQRPRLVLLGEIHNARRYHRQPDRLHGADAYFEEPADPADYGIRLRESLGLAEPPPIPSEAPDDPAAMTLVRELFSELLMQNLEALGALDAEGARAYCAGELAHRRELIEMRYPGRGALIDKLFNDYLRLKG